MDRRTARSRSTGGAATKKTPAKEKSPAPARKGRPRNKSPPPKKGKRSPSRSRSTKRAPSKSRSGKKPQPRPRSKSASRRSTSRSPDKRTRTKKSKTPDPLDVIGSKRLDLVIKDVLQDNFTKDTTLNEIIRRSVNREIGEQVKAQTVLRRSTRVSAAVKETEERISKKKKEDYRTSMKTSTTPGLEFGGWPGALISIYLVPALILLLHLACTREQCTLSQFHIPRNWRVYVNPEAFGIAAGFLVLQTLLTLLPLGRQVNYAARSGNVKFRCNGFLSLLITSSILGGLWYLKYPISMVYEKYIPLLVASAALGLLISIIVFIKGGRASVVGLNPFGMTGNKIYDFYVGRELNPVVLRVVNVKIALFRTAIIGTFVLNALLVLKAYEVRSELSYTVLCYAGLFNFFILELLWFEESLSSTFELLYEGTGAMVIQGNLLYPFLPTLITKYIIQYKVNLSIYGLVAVALFALAGYFIYRTSNLQKSAFRKNPLNPALAHFETINTNRGQKLLVSGWWGFVRHPNYLGDIISHWALAATAGYSHAIPYAVPLLVTLLLIHRAKRDDNRCRQRYLSSWDEYCSRVRYRIIPYVY